jgi:orotidine-5'-phosphate decarboxylase
MARKTKREKKAPRLPGQPDPIGQPGKGARTPPVTELVVALDFPRVEKALELVDRLAGLPVIHKIGSELFLAGGPELVRELVHRKCRVFLDLKFHDIPNTVARAARQAAFLKVEFFTVHLAGGSAMVRAVAQELADIPELRPRMLGVSVLTSFDDVRWAEVTRALTGHACETEESVLGLVEQSVGWGIDGIVCSAFELPLLRARHPSLYAVVPGIRPEGASSDDQGRVVTPREARLRGANAVVIGRPITQAQDPRSAAEALLRQLSGELSPDPGQGRAVP